MKTLRENWAQVGGAVEELEKEGKVFVTRTGGGGDGVGQMKAVFLDEIGERGVVDKGECESWVKGRRVEGRVTPSTKTRADACVSPGCWLFLHQSFAICGTLLKRP